MKRERTRQELLADINYFKRKVQQQGVRIGELETQLRKVEHQHKELKERYSEEYWRNRP